MNHINSSPSVSDEFSEEVNAILGDDYEDNEE
ncbi:hypothetical protein EV210_1235 [Anaerospora hongkongensis]|uniref:Uncharacterized protein n=1 Tax=Anaerospora hongkongensis TaxID=244830 RepID=A0A4R1PLS7_9FIRM|nr:hypothetical protein EV210_1235 [Anaerospora hongkongensis]